MKEKDFNVNNSNKLIVGIFILFCTVILIIGVTTAYFTQGTGSNIENIVATDELSLEYNDDVNNYMRQDLIPASRDNVITAYNRAEEGKKCLDINNHSACSIYRFSVKNTGNASQLLKMSLHPTGNSYKNLKFMLYEVTENGNILIKDTTDLEQFSVEPIIMSEAYTLGITDEDKEITFELVLYIEAQDYDQTGEDSGKQFGAGIRIDSITTGKYIVEGFGPNCWETDPKDRTTLVKFNGIDMDPSVEDDIDSMCSGYVTKEGNYYNITIPSNVGGQEITSIGNNLFNAYYYNEDTDEEYYNKYLNIKEINIENGIMEIEDGDLDNAVGAFSYIGYDVENNEYNLRVTLPNSLIKIGNAAFSCAQKLTVLTFNGALEKTNNLKIIGDYSFYETSINELIIPASVEYIGEGAFVKDNGVMPLNKLIFVGAENGTSNLKTIGEAAFARSQISTLTIPTSVEKIGKSAFINNEKLEILTFARALDGMSRLHKIGEEAFYNCNLNYTKKENPLILPSSITTMEEDVFDNNSNLKFIYFTGTEIGFSASWKGNAEIVTELVTE